MDDKKILLQKQINYITNPFQVLKIHQLFITKFYNKNKSIYAEHGIYSLKNGKIKHSELMIYKTLIIN